MAKLLLIGAVPVIITIGIFLFLARPKVDTLKTNLKESVNNAVSPLGTDGKTGTFPFDVSTDLSKEEFLQILEATASAINARIDALAKRQGITIPQTITPTATTTPTTIFTSGPKVAYIPLGSTGSSTSLNAYEDISATEIVINSADYPGYKKMYLESQIRIFQGNGQGDARIFDKTDGLGMSGSEISTTSENFSLKTSSGFTIPSGKKTYVVQLKSNTGYSVDLQTSRIRVEF